jgi:hypothetical protein
MTWARALSQTVATISLDTSKLRIVALAGKCLCRRDRQIGRCVRLVVVYVPPFTAQAGPASQWISAYAPESGSRPACSR